MGQLERRTVHTLTVQALEKALIMLAAPAGRKIVVSKNTTKELDGAERLAAIQRRLEILLRDAREIRAALTRLSDRDPFGVMQQTLHERASRTRPRRE